MKCCMCQIVSVMWVVCVIVLCFLTKRKIGVCGCLVVTCLLNKGSQVRSQASPVLWIETINRGPIMIFHDKLLTRTYCDEAADYAVLNVLSPRDLVFRPDLRTKAVHTRTGSGVSSPT